MTGIVGNTEITIAYITHLALDRSLNVEETCCVTTARRLQSSYPIKVRVGAVHANVAAPYRPTKGVSVSFMRALVALHGAKMPTLTVTLETGQALHMAHGQTVATVHSGTVEWLRADYLTLRDRVLAAPRKQRQIVPRKIVAISEAAPAECYYFERFTPPRYQTVIANGFLISCLPAEGHT